MLTLALIVCFGALALVLLSVFCTTRRAGHLARLRQEVEQEVTVIGRRAEQADQELAVTLDGGTPLDQAIGDYHACRAALVPGARSAHPWGWDHDDLARWKAGELRRRSEEMNRRLLLPALGGAVLVIALTITVCAITYHGLARRPDPAAVPPLPPAFDASLNTAPQPAGPATTIDGTTVQP